MRNIQKLKDALGRRIEIVIEESADPQAVMDEIALEAERRGLVLDTGILRRESPMAFVMDLWTDNPVILDRLSLYAQQVSINPRDVNDLASVLDVIP